VPSRTSSITHLSGISTLKKQVAGLHRASPSTALDKCYLIYSCIVAHFLTKIKSFSKILKNQFLETFKFAYIKTQNEKTIKKYI